MKSLSMSLAFVLAISFTFMSGPALAAPDSENSDYFELKGGYYYPSERIHVSQFSETDFDTRKGFDGEIAFGHHLAPILGTEFGIGYFADRRLAGTGPGRLSVDAIPVLVSLKLFLPLGAFEPYAGVGVGAYFTRFEQEGGIGGPQTFRKVNFGPHADIGLNLNFSKKVYLGLEGRYSRIRPEYGGERVRLDGYTATAKLGFRY